MDLDRLTDLLAREPAYRRDQIWAWAARGPLPHLTRAVAGLTSLREGPVEQGQVHDVER